MADSQKFARYAKNAAWSALILFSSALILSLLRAFLGRVPGEKGHWDWTFSLELSFALGVAWFIGFFAWTLILAVRSQPVLDILSEESSESELLKSPLAGFVGMECDWLIMNRTYLVFAASEGLYGWRARGSVTNLDRTYYMPYQAMLEDSDFMRDRRAIERRSRLRGGFFLERASITAVVADDRQKWGMGGIPHSGRIYLWLRSGRWREFILLGSVSPKGLRERIMHALGPK